MSLPVKARLQRRLLNHPRAYHVTHSAYALSRFLLRRPHEADFACFAHFRDRNRLFLDVGANCGSSALSFRIFHRDSPILSIEPNRYHEKDLRLLKRLLPRFEYMICAAGERNSMLTLHVPVYKGVPLTGEASLQRAGLEDSWSLAQLAERPARGDFAIAELAVEVLRLDDLRLAPDFVKIDVEGFELEVLRGLAQTLREHDPILLIEAATRVDEVCRLLGSFGYEPFVYRAAEDRLEPYDGAPTMNLFYIKRERTAAPPS